MWLAAKDITVRVIELVCSLVCSCKNPMAGLWSSYELVLAMPYWQDNPYQSLSKPPRARFEAFARFAFGLTWLLAFALARSDDVPK